MCVHLLMKLFRYLILPSLFVVSHVQAAPMPDPGRIRNLLAGSSETSFLVGFCDELAALDTAQIPDFHKSLTEGLADGSLPARHGRTALALTEQRWLDLDPKSLLETCAAGRVSIPIEMQAKALNSLLKKDLEAALKLYLLIPLNANFRERCEFFDRLSAIDPARAVRFYFETNECERSFDNPLHISFTAWAKRDFNAAWVAANAIKDEDKRETCVRILVGYTAQIGIDKTCDLLLKIEDLDSRSGAAKNLIYNSSFKIPQAIELARRLNSPELWSALNYPLREAKPAEAISTLMGALPEDQRVAVLSEYILDKCSHKPTPENTKELFALIPDEKLRSSVREKILNYGDEDKKLAMAPPQEEQFEALLAGGPTAFNEIQDGDKAAALAKAMCKRFPERSLPWALQFNDTYRMFRLRDLSECWPKEKIPTDAPRFLNSKDTKENEFGILLGYLWLSADPEKAIKTLFSRHPDYFKHFRGSVPYLGAERVGKLLDEIENPDGRAIVYQNWLVWRIREFPYDKRLREIIALDDDVARDRAIGNLVYDAMVIKPDAKVIDQILAIPDQHSSVRDRILMLYIMETTEEDRFDTGRTVEMITAIKDESNLLELIQDCRPGSTLKPYSQLICNRLAAMTPGESRDQFLREFFNGMSSANLLTLAKNSNQPLLRKLVIERLAELPQNDAISAEYEAIFNTLPASHRDPKIDSRWFLRKALLDPAAHWQEVLKRSLAYPEIMQRMPEIFATWQKKDAAATRRAVMAMDAEPRFAEFYEKQLMAESHSNPQATIDHILASSLEIQRNLSQVLRIQSEKAPSSACFNCLRIPNAKQRDELLRELLTSWLKRDAAAAITWIEAVPPGPDRYVIIQALSAAIYQKKDTLPEDALRKFFLKLSLSEMEFMLPSLPYPLRQSLEIIRKSRQESRSTLSALAEIDFETVSAKTRAMPAGDAKNLALLGLLDHALLRKKADLIDSLTRELLATDDAELVETTALTLINSLELRELDKAFAFIDAVRPLEVRVAIARRIIVRWCAAEFRPALETWIRAWPDPRFRQSLAGWYLRELLRVEKQNPETLGVHFDQAMKAAPATITRADLASALLDLRTADALAAAKAIQDPQLQATVEAWLQAQTPAKD
jgi:hypothetical protein